MYISSLKLDMKPFTIVILLPGNGLERINSKIHSWWRYFLEKGRDEIVNVRLDMEGEEYLVEGA